MTNGTTRALCSVLLTGLAACGGTTSDATDNVDDTEASGPSRLFIIGQDLDAIRGYMTSDCCPMPDGGTTYFDFYNLLAEPAGFGNIGLNANGDPIELETDYGAGAGSGYKTATEFGFRNLAVGLSITENDHPGGLDRILAGDYDANVGQLAALARHVEGTLYLRIGYEFDGFWNQGYEDAARYTAVFRHIVNELRSYDVDNVEYVWQGAASTADMVLDEGRHDRIRDWYPGDDYVDWLAISWFMHPDEVAGIELDFEVLTPKQLADEILELAREVGKPVMIAEAAPQAYDLRELTTAHHSPIWDGEAGSEVAEVSADEIWDGWFGPMFDYMNANDDVIRALAYINVRWDDQAMWGAPYANGYWGDTRVEANAEITQRFSEAVDAWRSAE